MNAERFKSFAAFAARLLGKPAFDREEREPRLRVAGELAEALAQVSKDPGSGGRLAGLLTGPGFRGADMTPGRQREWLAEWLETGDADLQAALASVADARRDELERFDAFADAYARAVDEGHVEADAAAATGVGSLLVFATEPQRLPLVFGRPGRALAELLGAEALPAGTPGERYRGHLEFARTVERDLRAAGVPVRDMLDVQSLIVLAARAPGFWADAGDDASPDAGRPRTPDVYLSVCAIYRDEAPYLREWIEFHRLVGVERFFLYDNRSADDHREVLAPYVASGIVRAARLADGAPGAAPGLRALLPRARRRSRAGSRSSTWTSSCSPRRCSPLPEILPEYERWPAVGVNWAVFGPSGHEQEPPGLVIESYDRAARTGRTDRHRTIKSIVDPAHVAEVTGVHAFRYDRLGTVDENQYPIYGGRTKSVSLERLRVNHYLTKSVEEYRLRAARARPDPAMIERFSDVARKSAWDEDSERDEAIMRFLPALREALSSTPQS